MPSEALSPAESNKSSPVTTNSDQSTLSPEKSSRRPSMIEVVKNIGTLTNIDNIANFFRRKDSVWSRDSPPKGSSPKPVILDCPHDRKQASSTRAGKGQMAYEGMAHFSNVSQFFNKREIAGESSNWYTIDEYLSLQNSSVVTITPAPVTNLEAGAETTRRVHLRTSSHEPNTRQEQPLQKSLLKDMLDIVFSWLSRRPSKKSRGKRPAPRNDSPLSSPLPLSAPRDIPLPRSFDGPARSANIPSSVVYPRTTFTPLDPPSFVEDFRFAVGPHSPYSLEAHYVSSGLSQPMSLLRIESPLPWINRTRSVPIPTGLSDDNPPPDVFPYSSNESFHTSATSLSSLGDSDHLYRPVAHGHHSIPYGAASSSSNIGAEGRSMPIDITTPNNGSCRSSTVPELTARPPDPQYLPTSCVPAVNEQPLWRASKIIFERRSGCPVMMPPSPDLLPITGSVSSGIQSLDLPSPRRPIMGHSETNAELVFPLTAVPSEEVLAGPGSVHRERQSDPVDEEDRLDFSLTHASPPDESATSHSGGYTMGTR